MDNNYITNEVDAKLRVIQTNNNVYDVGTVVKINNFIVEISGLDNVMFYERINISNKAFGYVNSIKEDVVVIALLKIFSPITIGDKASATNTLYTGKYSTSSMGRVIDLFGEDKLTGKTFDDVFDIPIERPTIPIMDRTTVNRPLLTGIAGIDLMYPIGKGQRQLIIGDKRTGKTQIGLDTIVNQKDKNVICFYVAIGKTKKEVKSIYYELVKRGCLDFTTIITAFNDELPPVISLIPYFALSIAENYLMEGFDILVVIDDLKRHAEAYREISLLSGKTPGRDAYPADIFYTHSRLLEKGCQHKNGGSITVLPIVETKGGDITDYISTNIISITDGQIVLSSKSFQKGEKPAIDYGLSVSRLGGQVQEKDIKKIGNEVRRKLLSYLETRSVYELVNMDEMSQELKNKFMEGKIILSSLNQYKFSPMTPEQMIELFGDFVEVPDDIPEKEYENGDDAVMNTDLSDASNNITASVEQRVQSVTDGPQMVMSDWDVHKEQVEAARQAENNENVVSLENTSTESTDVTDLNSITPIESVDLSSITPIEEVDINSIAPIEEVDINSITPIEEVDLNSITPIEEVDISNSDNPESTDDSKVAEATDSYEFADKNLQPLEISNEVEGTSTEEIANENLPESVDEKSNDDVVPYEFEENTNSVVSEPAVEKMTSEELSEPVVDELTTDVIPYELGENTDIVPQTPVDEMVEEELTEAEEKLTSGVPYDNTVMLPETPVDEMEDEELPETEEEIMDDADYESTGVIPEVPVEEMADEELTESKEELTDAAHYEIEDTGVIPEVPVEEMADEELTESEEELTDATHYEIEDTGVIPEVPVDEMVEEELIEPVEEMSDEELTEPVEEMNEDKESISDVEEMVDEELDDPAIEEMDEELVDELDD